LNVGTPIDFRDILTRGHGKKSMKDDSRESVKEVVKELVLVFEGFAG